MARIIIVMVGSSSFFASCGFLVMIILLLGQFQIVMTKLFLSFLLFAFQDRYLPLSLNLVPSRTIGHGVTSRTRNIIIVIPTIVVIIIVVPLHTTGHMIRFDSRAVTMDISFRHDGNDAGGFFR